MKGAGGGKYLIKYSLLACLVLRIILIGQGASSDHVLEEILKLLMIYNPGPVIAREMHLTSAIGLHRRSTGTNRGPRSKQNFYSELCSDSI